MPRKVAVQIAVVALSALAAAVSAQRRPSAKPMALTPLDYVEIRQLVSRSAFAIDTGSNNGYDYADLFAGDGESVRPDAKGREQLAALARGDRLGPDNTAHYVMNHVIEPTPDGAIGKEYLVQLNWNVAPAGGGARGGGPIDQWALIGRKAGELAGAGGHYEDVYIKTPAGWRFRRREFIPSRRGADAPPVALRRPSASSPTASTSVAPQTGTTFVAPTMQSALTALDYLEIAQVVSSYGHALDSGYGKGENGEPYANLYTADAAFAGADGHDQLVKLAQIQPRGPDYVRHYLTNHIIEPMPGGAKGKEFLVVIDIGENGRPSSLFLGGHYEDTYVKTPEGWRIKTRRLNPPRPGPRPGQPAAPSVPIASPATAAGRNALTLSSMDYIDIQQLVARSAYSLDAAAGSGPAYVSDFTTNYVVSPSAEGATGRVYVVRLDIGENGTPGVIRGGGHYDDVYERTSTGWKIKRRAFVPSRLGARDVYAPAPASSQAAATSAPRPIELTALDYIQIQQLVAKYAQYIDTCSNNGYDYADLFADDGFFAPFRNGQLGPKSQGREALARASGGGPDGCTGAGWIRQGVHHMYVNHVINPTPDGASGQVNMLMIGLGGDKNKIEHDGYYEDTYVKTAQGWKFKSRIHHATWTPPPSQSGR
jgi:SnoaL-like domain